MFESFPDLFRNANSSNLLVKASELVSSKQGIKAVELVMETGKGVKVILGMGLDVLSDLLMEFR